MKTPQYITRTLAAGAFASIAAPGNYLTVASISASTFAVGIDGETPAQVIAGGRTFVKRGFTLLRVQNTGGVAGVLVLVVTEDEYNLADAANAAVLAAIAASVAGVDLDTNQLLPSTSHVNIPVGIVAQDGVGDTLIVAAAAMNRDIEINADLGNAGCVYLSHLNPATIANAFTALMAGGSWSGRTTETIRACSDNGTEQVRGVIRRA